MDPSEIRKKIGRFRILIIGRANAGKTTILQRVCNTREKPEIYNSAGKKIDAAVLIASRERGLHDINNEMVFRSNPGFVFHDSRGFEAGGESEFDKVKAFITDRSKETRIQNRLHAIWYCIPMDEASRSFTRVEMKFFSECDTGSIPVIVLFTKFDALYEIAYAELISEGVLREKAEELAPKHAEDSFAIGPQLKFLYNSKDIQRPPKCHVCLPNMDKDDADCWPLIERTAEALDDQVVEQLFVSTTQNNLELCMKYAVEKTLPGLCDSANITAPEGQEQIIGKLGAWFPHVSAVSFLILL
jgi:GTP-binding protein EngB required for normal cell division